MKPGGVTRLGMTPLSGDPLRLLLQARFPCSSPHQPHALGGVGEGAAGERDLAEEVPLLPAGADWAFTSFCHFRIRVLSLWLSSGWAV